MQSNRKHDTHNHHGTYTDTRRKKINVEIIKRIKLKKTTILPSLWNKNRKKVKAESEKINKLLTNISMNNIMELNELIYAGAKLVCNKIGVPQGIDLVSHPAQAGGGVSSPRIDLVSHPAKAEGLVNWNKHNHTRTEWTW